MSIGKEMPFQRSARDKDATGSLLFDAERKRELSKEGKGKQAEEAEATAKAAAKKRAG